MSTPSQAIRPPGQNAEQNSGFDHILKQLRQIVALLEQGQLSLEQALLAFEEGVALSRKGAEILDQAEHRVELLVKDDQSGLQTQPWSIDLGKKD